MTAAVDLLPAGAKLGQLLIARHMKAETNPSARSGSFTAPKAAAGAIADCLGELPASTATDAGAAHARPEWYFRSAGSEIAERTARVIRQQLVSRSMIHADPPRSLPDLAPKRWSPYGGGGSNSTLVDLARAVDRAREHHRLTDPASPTLVLVLHDPQTQWLIRRLTGRSISLSHGGAAWLVPRPWWRWHPTRRWSVWTTVDHEEPGDLRDLRAKIETKYRTAGALGGFLTGLFTFLASRYAERTGDGAGSAAPATTETYLWLTALAAIAIGAALNFLALFEYDRLLMPKRFWTSRRPSRSGPRARPVVARPPGGSAQVLVQGAQRVWTRLVVWSAVFLVLGLLAFTGTLTQPREVGDVVWWLPGLGAALLGVVGAWYRWLARPGLGASD